MGLESSGVIFIASLLMGCTAMTPDQVFESDYRAAMNAENWERCQVVYSAALIPTWSTHQHQRHRPHRDWQVRDDLRMNNCRRVLGKEEWLE